MPWEKEDIEKEVSTTPEHHKGEGVRYSSLKLIYWILAIAISSVLLMLITINNQAFDRQERRIQELTLQVKSLEDTIVYQQICSPTGAFLSREALVFIFPLPKQTVWNWNLTSTQTNHFEYQWQVFIPLKNNTEYNLRLYHLKSMQSKLTSGSVDNLFQSVHEELWVSTTNNGGRFVDADITTVVNEEQGQLLVNVNGSEVVQHISSLKMPYVLTDVKTPYYTCPSQIVRFAQW